MKTVQFIQFSPEELETRITKILKAILKPEDSLNTKEPNNPFLTRQEVAEMLKINLSTVHNWTKQGKLIPYGIGNRVYYKFSDIEKAIIKLK
ncbi:helix-turn-helix domain-containing protein [Joostella sp.]|uniref:helix-turn-helix domain-containing protein n=1 Tax=Joostella sp. TaxID=2231138 RepID=UPI003A8F3BA8